MILNTLLNPLFVTDTIARKHSSFEYFVLQENQTRTKLDENSAQTIILIRLNLTT